MKTLRYIILLIIIPAVSLFGQNELDDINKTAEGEGRFQVRIEAPLALENSIDFVYLGEIVPGQTKTFKPGSQSVEFKIQGQINREVIVKGRVYNESKRVSLNGLKWEYWDGYQWQPVLPFANSTNAHFFENFVHTLDDNGSARIRVFPTEVTAASNAETGQSVDFNIQISCDYQQM